MVSVEPVGEAVLGSSWVSMFSGVWTWLSSGARNEVPNVPRKERLGMTSHDSPSFGLSVELKSL